MIKVHSSLRLDSCGELQLLALPLPLESKALLIHFSIEGACLSGADDGVGVLYKL